MKSRKLALLIFLLLISACTSESAKGTETSLELAPTKTPNIRKTAESFLAAEEAYFQGYALFYEEEYEGAISQFTNAINIAPDMAQSYVFRAFSFNVLEEYEKAIEDFRMSLKFEDPSVWVYRGMAESYRLLGKIAEAIEVLDEGAELFPDSGMILMMRAVLKGTLEEYIDAIKDMEAALELDDDDLEAEFILRGRQLLQTWKEEVGPVPTETSNIRETADSFLASEEAYDQGYALFYEEKYELAISQFTNAINLAPYMAQTYVFRAFAFEAIEEYEKAIEDFRMYLASENRLDDPVAEVYTGMANSYRKLGKIAKAIEVLDEAAELFPDSGKILLIRAVLKGTLEEYIDAIKDMEAALELDDDDLEAEFILQGRELIQAWKVEIGLVPVAGEEDEKDIELASNLINNADYVQAISILNRILEEAEVPDAYYYRGYAYSELGYQELAIADYLIFLDYNDSIPQAFTNFAVSLFKNGEIESGILALDRAIEMEANGMRLYLRGYQKIELNDYAGAREDIELALQIGLPGDFKQEAQSKLDFLETITVE